MSGEMTKTIVIDTIEICMDQLGRFCLNDLHKAAGGESRHKPGDWMRLDRTKALIAALGEAEIPASDTIQPVSVVKGGNSPQGTYVTKELVYDYAMWISPAFNIRVIRAYDAMAAAEAHRVRNRTELERIDDEMKALARYRESILERDALQERVDRSVMFARTVPEDDGSAFISVADINESVVPWAQADKIALVLSYFEHPKTYFRLKGDSEAAMIPVWRREGIEAVFDRFKDGATMLVSVGRKSIIVRHESLLGKKMRVKKGKAIRYLGFTEEDFAD